jgi:hypothetical protein
MGKRELLLIIGFLCVGVVAYHVTAPAGAAGGGFSVSGLIEKIRREVRGQNYELQTTRTATAEADGDVRAVRLDGLRGSITITGEDRRDVSAELHVSVFGADEPQARTFRDAVSLAFEPDGETLNLRARVRTDEMRRGPHVQLVVRVPKRLGVRLSLGGGELEVAHVASVTFERGSGKAVLSNVAGAVTGEYGGGSIEIDQAGSVDLETRRAEVRIVNVAGPLKLDARSGEVRVHDVHGPSELMLERIDAEVEDVHGPLTVEGNGGELRIRNVRAAVKASVERMELSITMAAPVPVEASTMGDTLEIALPSSGGFTLDASTDEGDIRASDSAITVATNGGDRRAQATLRGGGPLIKLESRRGDIVIR